MKKYLNGKLKDMTQTEIDALNNTRLITPPVKRVIEDFQIANDLYKEFGSLENILLGLAEDIVNSTKTNSDKIVNIKTKYKGI